MLGNQERYLMFKRVGVLYTLNLLWPYLLDISVSVVISVVPVYVPENSIRNPMSVPSPSLVKISNRNELLDVNCTLLHTSRRVPDSVFHSAE